MKGHSRIQQRNCNRTQPQTKSRTTSVRSSRSKYKKVNQWVWSQILTALKSCDIRGFRWRIVSFLFCSTNVLHCRLCHHMSHRHHRRPEVRGQTILLLTDHGVLKSRQTSNLSFIFNKKNRYTPIWTQFWLLTETTPPIPPPPSPLPPPPPLVVESIKRHTVNTVKNHTKQLHAINILSS